MDYKKFNCLTEKVMNNASTDEEEKELISILQNRIEERKQAMKRVIYNRAAKEISTSINNYLKDSDNQALRVKIDGSPYKNSDYMDIKSAYYDSAQDILIFRTPKPFNFDD